MVDLKQRIFELFKTTNDRDYPLETKIGLPRNTLYQWRHGCTKPSLDACIKIADYFNITLDELVGRNKPEQHEITAYDPTTRELLNGWQTLNETQRQRVLGLIEGLKQPSGIEQAFNAGRSIGREEAKSTTKNHGGNIA